ncbi:ABC transporter substrate-binding protein [Paenibacillus sanguinis]|uniref:ABC transporter substrate-binding protein n=1 Tax=Paenibacillus sanguinis TaxID=225906 RepID=UPI00036C4195|nr:ABC transporter substrate-binding protein [Paenibacillus sanguinis]
MRFSLSKSGLLAILAAVLLIAGCSSGASSTSPPEADKTSSPPAVAEDSPASADVPLLRLAWAGAGYPSPFAFSASGPGGFLRNSFLFDTLTWKDSTGVIPWLAKSWKISEDGLSYTFELEPEVKWHDGQLLTAADVVFSFDYYKEHPFMWTGDISQIESVTASGDLQVTFRLKGKYAPFLSDLVGIVPIIPKHVWETVDNPVEYRDPAALVGTGPYVLEEFDEKSGQYAFVANENYFKGYVKVKEIQYLNPSNKILALQNGEIDATMTTSYGDVEQLTQAGLDVIQSDPTGSALRITFNLQHEQLKDKKLRQAIAYAINRADMAQKITGAEPMVGSAGIIPPDSDWFNTKVKSYDYQPEEAEKLLDELGYVKNSKGIRDKLRLSVMVSSTSKEAQFVQEDLKKIGIELTIKQVDGAAFTAAMGENQYDMAITGHIGLSGDPDFLRLWFLGEASNAYAARGKVFDEQNFQQLAVSQKEELDPTARKLIIDQMQDVLADELPTLVLYHRPFYYLYQPQVFAGWFNTSGGIGDGIPLWDNKAAFIDENH